MAFTHFETFIDAFAATDRRSRLLGGDAVLCPPSKRTSYQSTPKNAVTFSRMGVDGVHYAVLKLDGQVRDDSPVVYVSPTDSDDLAVVAESFLSFLAVGCRVSMQKMQSVFNGERSGKRQLVAYLAKHFDAYRLLGEKRTRLLTARCGHLIERKRERA